MKTFSVEGYRLVFNRTAQTENAFAKGIPFYYMVTISHTTAPKLKVTLPYASGREVKDLPEAAKVLANMCNAALVGALAPSAFCALMGINPEESLAEAKFCSVREVSEKIYSVLANRHKPAELMNIIYNGGVRIYKETT